MIGTLSRQMKEVKNSLSLFSVTHLISGLSSIRKSHYFAFFFFLFSCFGGLTESLLNFALMHLLKAGGAGPETIAASVVV